MMAPSSNSSEERILNILRSCRNFRDVEASGFLFHGTCETIEGALRPSPYDEVFWAARTPTVAQAYIPRSGITQIVARPSDNLLDDPIRPRSANDAVTAWALSRARAHWDDLEAEEHRGRIASWRVLPGWPRNSDLVAHIENDLGYTSENYGCWEVSIHRSGDTYKMKPAGWTMPGSLILLHAPGLEISATDWQESEIGGANHNRLDAFDRFAREGRAAFSMPDLLQSKFHGNYGHEAIGILPDALSKLDWIAIPAVRHDGPEPDIFRQKESRDFLDFMDTVSPSYQESLPEEDLSFAI